MARHNLIRNEKTPAGCCPLCLQSIHHYVNEIEIYPDFNAIRRGHRIVQLTEIQFDILRVLAESYPNVISAEMLITRVYGGLSDRVKRNLHVHSSKLRQNLKAINLKIVYGSRDYPKYILRIEPIEEDLFEKARSAGRTTRIGGAEVTADCRRMAGVSWLSPLVASGDEAFD